MTGPLEILEAIQVLASQELSELERIYLERVPQDFHRPSLLLELIRTQNRRANHSLIHCRQDYTLTLFAKTDPYGHSDPLELIKLQEQVLHLFRRGYLAVGDRALSVTASDGGRDWDRAWVDLTLEFLESGKETATSQPLMEEIHLTLT